MMPSIQNVHLVGSIRLPHELDNPLANPPSPRTIFTAMANALPGRLRRMPDGETGERHYFVNWQIRVFEHSPWLLNDRERSRRSMSVPDNAESLSIQLGPPGYDNYAFAAFKAFDQLQQQGIIEPDVRFQVCIPTPIQPICRYVRQEFRAQVEPIYEETLRKAIADIQTRIPSEKLAFQFDCAMEFAMLEGVPGPGGAFSAWFEVTPQSLVEKIIRVVDAVHPDAQIGFHFCYGDLQHRHFIEPKDTTKLVEMSNLISSRVARNVDFLHLPIPQNRTDDEYFAALSDLRLSGETEIYLGLVHAHDLDGTIRRIEAAKRAIRHFGIATECGWGRTPVKDIESILSIQKSITSASCTRAGEK